MDRIVSRNLIPADGQHSVLYVEWNVSIEFLTYKYKCA